MRVSVHERSYLLPFCYYTTRIAIKDDVIETAALRCSSMAAT